MHVMCAHGFEAKQGLDDSWCVKRHEEERECDVVKADGPEHCQRMGVLSVHRNKKKALALQQTNSHTLLMSLLAIPHKLTGSSFTAMYSTGSPNFRIGTQHSPVCHLLPGTHLPIPVPIIIVDIS